MKLRWRILFFILLPALLLASLPPTIGRMFGIEGPAWVSWSVFVVGLTSSQVTLAMSERYHPMK
jgi:hypothetical protein